MCCNIGFYCYVVYEDIQYEGLGISGVFEKKFEIVGLDGFVDQFGKVGGKKDGIQMYCFIIFL